MNKFEEMRLRAIKFQELTKCCMEIFGDADYFLLHHHPTTGIKQPDFSFQQIGDTEIRFYRIGSPRPVVDADLSVPESEWLAGIEKVFGRPFPTLLEAQGWIEVEDGLPKDKEMTQVCVDMFGSVVSGVSVGFKNHPERPFFSNVSTTDGTWCGGYGIIGEVRVTHWKPLEVFPQPFEPSNV